MSKQNFQVTPHYHLPTAWKATYTHGNGSQRTIGINSEMDALPGIGHACGHNIIAMAGVAVACAIKAAMEKFNIAGKIVLLGTPGPLNIFLNDWFQITNFSLIIAEEGANGKNILLKHGAYEEMDICLMCGFLHKHLGEKNWSLLWAYYSQRCHPAPGPRSSVSLSGSLALFRTQVEYFGHTYASFRSFLPAAHLYHIALMLPSHLGKVKMHSTRLSSHTIMSRFFASR